MDKLMVGYGVTGNNNDAKKFQHNTVALPTIQSQPAAPKKELTLVEKQQLASQFEANNTATKKDMSNSFSLQNLNNSNNSMRNTQTKAVNDNKKSSDLMTDNFMSSNLNDLGLSSQSKSNNGFGNQMAIMNGPSSFQNSSK